MAYQLPKKVRDLIPYDPISGSYQIRLDANESLSLIHIFLQVSDHDCSVYDNWLAVGSDQPFRGVYDGGGRRIKNLTMTGSAKYCGVFGQLGGATIQNLGVDASCSFNLEQGLIGGGIVAQSSRGDNQIRQCFSEADIRILDTQGNTCLLYTSRCV